MKNLLSEQELLVLDKHFNFLNFILKGSFIITIIAFTLLSVFLNIKFCIIGLVLLATIAYYFFLLNKRYKDVDSLALIKAKCVERKLYHLRYHRFIFKFEDKENGNKEKEFSLIYSNKNKYSIGKSYLFCVYLKDIGEIEEANTKDIVLTTSYTNDNKEHID